MGNSTRRFQLRTGRPDGSTFTVSVVAVFSTGEARSASRTVTFSTLTSPKSLRTTMIPRDEQLTSHFTPSPFAPPSPSAGHVLAPAVLDFRGDSPVAETFEVTLFWFPADDGDPPTEYVIEAGSTFGAQTFSASVDASATAVTALVPAGTYYVRVRGKDVFGLGPPSNEVLLQLGSDNCTTAPSMPGALTAEVDGLRVRLRWGTAAQASSYLLEAGSTPGGIEYGRANIGALTQFDTTAPAATYYLRVRGTNSCGLGPVSNEVVATLTTTIALPGAPFGLLARVIGSTVELRWEHPATGGAADDFQVEVGTQPGLANLGTGTTPSSVLTFTQAPRGTYYVRVRARNVAGTGPASADLRIDVP